MRMTDHDLRQGCRVIPFVRPPAGESQVETSTIAAVIAVTILHHEGQSPEDRLMDIIEASGEAEVLDIVDAMEEFESLPSSQGLNLPANDNKFLDIV